MDCFDFVVVVFVDCLDCCSDVADAVAADSFDFFVDVVCFEFGSDVADRFDANGFDFDASCTI